MMPWMVLETLSLKYFDKKMLVNTNKTESIISTSEKDDMSKRIRLFYIQKHESGSLG